MDIERDFEIKRSGGGTVADNDVNAQNAASSGWDDEAAATDDAARVVRKEVSEEKKAEIEALRKQMAE